LHHYLSRIKAHTPASNNHHSNKHQSFVQQTALTAGQKSAGKDNQTESDTTSDIQSQVQLNPSPFGVPLRGEPFVPSTVFGQPKLNIGKPNDKYEVEADRVADQVVAKSITEAPKGSDTPPPLQTKDSGGAEESEGVAEEPVQMMEAPEKEAKIQEKPISESITTGIQLKPIAPNDDSEVQKMEAEPEGEAEMQMKLDASTEAPENIQKAEAPADISDLQKTAIQTKCASCGTESSEKLNVQQKCTKCEKEAEVQTKSDNASNSVADVESSLKSSKGKGSAMDDNTRSSMESGFGADFSGVRIHTDSNAVQMNKSLGSQAFANGSDVYFNEGKYNPSSKDGQHLLAHELTHTVQQNASPKGIQKQIESTEGEEATVQMQLDVNAERLYEERIVHDNTVSSASNNAAGEANEETQDGNAENENAEDLSTQADAGSENDGNANENTNDSNTGQGGEVIENNGTNEGNCEPECYREPTEEPDEEPDEAPENPEAAQVEAEGDDGGQDDVWEEIDDCPTDQAEAAGASIEPSEGATAEGDPAATSEGNPDQENANPENTENAENTEGDADSGGGDKEKAPAPSGNGLAGVISSAEGERSKSVAAYQASSSSLSGTASKNEAVKGQVSFVPNPSENTKQNEQRQQATGRANDFFSSIGNRLADATSYGLEAIPNRIGTTAEAAKAQIAASMEAQKSTISARIERARGEARVKAEVTRQAVHTQTTNYISDVEAQTATAIETLNTTYTDTMTNIGDLETTTLDMINEMYVEGRARLIDLGPTIGNECKETARTMAVQYKGFHDCTENGFWDGNLSQRRANAQAEAATSVGQTYYDNLTDTARQQAIEVTKNGRKVDRCSIIASANQSRSTLDESLPQLIGALESTRDAAIQQARATETSLIAGIDASLTSTLDQLDEQEYTQRQAINDTGYMQQVMQESTAHAAAAFTQQGIQSAVSSVQTSLMQLKAQFSSNQAPDPNELDSTLSQVEQNINSAVDGLFTSADTGISRAESQLNNNLQQAISSLRGITQSNEDATSQLMGAFTTGMNGISGVDNFANQRTSYTTQVQQSVDSSVAALVQSLDGLQQSCDGTIEAATTRLEQSEADLEATLRQNQEGLQCEITASADEAASKEAPAWKQLLAILIIILVIIIVVALTIFTAGAGGAALVAALGGPLLAGAIIGAVVGAVVSGLITMATNLWTNQDVMEGVGAAMLKGAITGAAGGFLGAAAGVGAGVVFSKGVQVAAQFGAAMISGGGFDVVMQYIDGGFSFDNFSWGQLGFTLFVTALTFGIGHVAGTRANVGPIDADGGTPVIDGPDGAPVIDTPEATPVIDTPEATPVVDAPEATPVVDTPESTPVVDTPESNPVVDTPESNPVVDGPESTPVTDTPENAPVNDGPENTPVNDADATPVNDGDAPVLSEHPDGAYVDDAGTLHYEGDPPGTYRTDKGRLKDSVTNRFVEDPNRVQPVANEGQPRPDLPEVGSPKQQQWLDHLRNPGDPNFPPCFPSGTLVATPDGYKTIESIQLNDAVWSYDHFAKKVKLQLVTDLFTNWTQYMMHIHLENSTISATRSHPFWEEEEEKYLRAEELSPGMKLRCKSGDIVEVKSVNKVLTQEVTYNLEVSELHNYFVGNEEILVHNTDPPSIGSFASNEVRPSTVYVFSDGFDVIYVGQTIDFDARFQQHLTDPTSSVHKYLVRQLGPDFTPAQGRARLSFDLPVRNQMLTHYELTALEQYHMDIHGGVDGLENTMNAMTPESRTRYATTNNPC